MNSFFFLLSFSLSIDKPIPFECVRKKICYIVHKYEKVYNLQNTWFQLHNITRNTVANI